MPQFIVKHDTFPEEWARVESKNGGQAIFGSRARATVFASAHEAMEAFQTASDAMWARVLASRSGLRGAWPPSRPIPNWLLGQRKEPLRGAVWGPKGNFVVEELAEPFDPLGRAELFFARGEKGWLTGDPSKGGEMALRWTEDFAKARFFLSQKALSQALGRDPEAIGVSVLTFGGTFERATLPAKGADPQSLEMGAGVERRDLGAAAKAASGARARSL